MPVISTAFDDDFFDEPVIQSDRIESPCKRKCSKQRSSHTRAGVRNGSFHCRMRYEHISTRVRQSQSGDLPKSVSPRLQEDSQRRIRRLSMSPEQQHGICR